MLYLSMAHYLTVNQSLVALSSVERNMCFRSVLDNDQDQEQRTVLAGFQILGVTESSATHGFGQE